MEKNNQLQKILFISRDDAASVKIVRAIFNTLIERYKLDWSADAVTLSSGSVSVNQATLEAIQAKGYHVDDERVGALDASKAGQYRVVVTLGSAEAPASYGDIDTEQWEQLETSSDDRKDTTELIEQIEAKAVKFVNKLHEYMDPRLSDALQDFVSAILTYAPEVAEFNEAKDQLHAHPESLALWNKKQEIQETMKMLQDSGLPVDDEQRRVLSETMQKMRGDAHIMRYLRAQTFAKRATGYIGYLLEENIGVDFASRKEC